MSEGLKQTLPLQIFKYIYYNLRDVTIKQLVNNQIIQRSNYNAILNRKPDGLILHNKKVLAVIEYKSTKEFNTKKKRQSAIEQSIDIAIHLKAKILIATDGQNTIWVNSLTGENIIDEKQKPVTFTLDYKKIPGNIELEKLIDKINDSVTKTNNTIILPQSLDPYLLAKKIWQKIWINTGKEPEKCLYNVVELFIFKFLSDLDVLKPESLRDFSTLYKLSQSSNKDALKHYAKSIRTRICDLFPKGKDKTTLINGTIFVTENGEPNLTQARLFSELLQDFWEYEQEQGTFKNIDKNFKTKLFESFLKQSAGIKRLGQFFTPRKIVQAMIQMTDIENLKKNNRICDPFCGVGGFLLEAINLNKNLQKQYRPEKGKIELKIELKGFDQGTEEKEDERTIILAKANMLIYFSELIEEYHTEEDIKLFSGIINDTFELIRDNLGTLKKVGEKGFDLILSNPPYVSKGAKSIKNEISSRGLSEHYTFDGTGIEGQCVEWIVRNLSPYGKAYIIVPDSILRRTSDKNLRKNMMKYCYIDAILSLPLRTFYATAKKTYILAFTKKENTEDKQDFPIFSYLIREIGESRDANRIEIPDKTDLPTMLDEFNQFKGNKKRYISKDPLCKIIPFTQIEKMNTWIIEDKWTRAEKEKLKIVDENPSISIDDFSELITETISTLNNLQYNLSVDLQSINFENIQLGDSQYFKPFTSLLGYTKKEYLPLHTKNKTDIPIYTAQKEAVAYIKKMEEKSPIDCSEENPHVSIASDGDGTAGTNIIYHTAPYYLNTSRISYSIQNKNIFPLYVYYAIQGIKQEYGFNYSHKATLQNQAEVNITIPVKSGGQFDVSLQKKLAEKFKQIDELKLSIKQLMGDIVGAKVSLK